MLHNYGLFVVAIVDCSVRVGGIGTHSCAIGLHEEFSLNDVAFFLGDRKLNNETSSYNDIESATAVPLTFTTQKNGHKNEVIAHARSGDPLCCLVTTAARQFLVHRRHRRHRNLPYEWTIKLAVYYNSRGVKVL